MAAIVKSLSAQQVIAVELNRKAIDKELTKSTGTWDSAYLHQGTSVVAVCCGPVT